MHTHRTPASFQEPPKVQPASGPRAAHRLRISRVRGAAAGRLLVLALTAGVVCAVAAATVHMPILRQLPPPPPAPPPPPMTNSELEVALLRAGLSPESLAAAGFTGTQTGSLVTRAREELSESITAYRSAQSTLATERARVENLERKVRSGLGNQQQDVADLAAARTALATAQATVDSSFGAVRAAALGEGQSPDRLSLLDTIRSNNRWRFPTQYLCKAATEAEWVRLRNALSIKRQAEQDNEQVPPEAQRLLSTWNADAAVSAAAANLSLRRAEVKTAWDRAIDGTP